MNIISRINILFFKYFNYLCAIKTKLNKLWKSESFSSLDGGEVAPDFFLYCDVNLNETDDQNGEKM